MTGDVRQATTDDVWAVHETARESWHAAYDEILGPQTVDDVVDDWYAIGDLESSIDDASGREDVAFLVADPSPQGRESDSDSGFTECHGFAHVVPWPEDPAVAYLARIYVRPDVWGSGTGTALLEHLEADLEAAFDWLRLSVLTDNDIGISFYESAGFERLRTRETDLAANLEEYVYEKRLGDDGR